MLKMMAEKIFTIVADKLCGPMLLSYTKYGYIGEHSSQH